VDEWKNTAVYLPFGVDLKFSEAGYKIFLSIGFKKDHGTNPILVLLNFRFFRFLCQAVFLKNKK